MRYVLSETLCAFYVRERSFTECMVQFVWFFGVVFASFGTFELIDLGALDGTSRVCLRYKMDVLASLLQTSST